MNTKNHKGRKKLDPNKVKGRRPRKFLVYRGVDFERVENAPVTELEKEIQAKLASEASPLEILMDKERRRIMDEAITKVKLSESERKCIKLILKGKTHSEIAGLLDRKANLIHYYTQSAIRKLSRYVIKRYGR